MKKWFLCLLFPIFCLSLYAQKTQRQLLEGSWQLTDYASEGKIFPAVEFSALYSFYADSVYQIKRTYARRDSLGNPVKDTSSYEGGIWCLCCKNAVSFRNNHPIPQITPFYNDFYNQNIEVLNDTALVLWDTEGEVKYYSYFRRIAPLPKIEDSYIAQERPDGYSFISFVQPTLQKGRGYIPIRILTCLILTTDIRCSIIQQILTAFPILQFLP